jgi:hypothetical protein
MATINIFPVLKNTKQTQPVSAPSAVCYPSKDTKDFFGKELNVGDYVLYTKKFGRLFSYGIIIDEIVEEEKQRRWPDSVLVKRITPHIKGKYKDQFPCESSNLIKISKEEIALKILEHGNTNFLKG